ncbi:MAG: type II toxin-antitoxin system VapC family toxin [Nitrospirota bacterium]
MGQIVIDASALLALLFGETGHEMVDAALDHGVMNAVNLAEVASRLFFLGADEQTTRDRLGDLPVEIIPFTAEHAYRVGLLRVSTKAQGLSLGDRACIATAEELNLPALTSDQSWSRLKLKIPVQVIR